MKRFLLLSLFAVNIVLTSDKNKHSSILPPKHHHHHRDVEQAIPMIVINTSSSEEFNRNEDDLRPTRTSTPWYCTEKFRTTLITATASMVSAAISAGITLAAMSNDCKK